MVVRLREKYSPDQPRDHGRFARVEGDGAAGETAGAKFQTKQEAEQAIHALLRPSRKKTSVSFSVDEALLPLALQSARSTYDVLSEMKSRGYVMPTDVMFTTRGLSQSPEGYTFMGGPIMGIKGHTYLEIAVPGNLPAEAASSLDAAVKIAFQSEPGQFSVASMRDIVIHEMGHVQAGMRNRGFLERTEREVARKVSNYAGRNHDEFLAESFTRLYRGEKLQPEAQALYERLNGPKIR